MGRALRLLLFFASWIGAGAAAVFAVGVVVGIGISPALGLLSPLALLLLLPMIGMSARLSRRQRAITTLGYVEQAIRLKLPLPRMLLAAEQSESLAAAAELRRLRELLEEGAGLEAALEQALPGLPRRLSALTGSAQRLGSLPQTLGQLMRDEQRKRMPQDSSSRAFGYAYPIMMLLFLSAVLGAIGLLVIPRFKQIFADFRVHLPWVTVQTFAWAQLMAPMMLMAMTLIALGLIGRALWEAFRPLGPDAHLSRQIVDHVIGVIPIARLVARDRALGDSCQMLADALEQSVPMDQALRDPSHRAINCALARRLDRWADGIDQGLGVGEAARQAGLPHLLVGLVGTRQTTPDLAGVLGFLARYYRWRFGRMALLSRAAAIPAMVLFFALCVGWVALSLFLPMVKLIDAVAPWSRAL